MKKLVVSVLLALGVFCQVAWAPAPALAAEKEWSVDLAAAYNSKYIWRGIMQVDDPVLQPSLNVNKGGLTFNVWGSYDLTSKNNHKNNVTEIDLTAEYAFTLGDFTVPVGVINYQFPNTTFDSTTELYAGVSYNWVIVPSLKVFKDIDESHGIYVLGALSYAYDLPAVVKDVTSQLTASISGAWADKDNNKFYWGGTDSDAFTDSLLTIGLPIKIKETVTVTPAFNQVWLLDSKIKDAAGYDSKSFFGVTVSVSF
ncbi:MAG: TorF family putative porin [Pseudomonadota bacterium]